MLEVSLSCVPGIPDCQEWQLLKLGGQGTLLARTECTLIWILLYLDTLNIAKYLERVTIAEVGGWGALNTPGRIRYLEYLTAYMWPGCTSCCCLRPDPEDTRVPKLFGFEESWWWHNVKVEVITELPPQVSDTSRKWNMESSCSLEKELQEQFQWQRLLEQKRMTARNRSLFATSPSRFSDRAASLLRANVGALMAPL